MSTYQKAFYNTVIAELENVPLYNNTGGFQFYFDSGGLNIGFGFDVSTNFKPANDSDVTNDPPFIVSALEAAGLNFNQDQLDYSV
jgi:hypothetical protein